jgi:hypothetical protein
VVTNVSEEPAASILRVEDGGSKFLHNVGNHNKTKKCYNSLHNPNRHYHENHIFQVKNQTKLQLDETERRYRNKAAL